jgi:hypothetical protein
MTRARPPKIAQKTGDFSKNAMPVSSCCLDPVRHRRDKRLNYHRARCSGMA